MIPVIVQWELTEQCCYECVHCYLLGDRPEPPMHGLSDDQLRQIAQQLIDHHLFFVTFTGGEPLMRKPILIELASTLANHGIQVSVNTCLALLDSATLGSLQKHRFLISCPSTNPILYRTITGCGDYRRFERNLEMVIASGTSHAVNMVVSQLNKQDVRSTAQHLAQLGINLFAATPVSLNARSPRFDLTLSQEDVRRVLDDLVWVHEEFGLSVDVMEALPKCVLPLRAFELNLPFVYRSCQAGQRNGTIGPLGDVRPCGHNPLSYGNVLQEDLGAIWDRLGGWRKDSGNQHHSCLACDAFSSCHGGCGIDVKVIHENGEGRHPYMVAPIPVTDFRPTTPSLTGQTIVRPSRMYLERSEDEGSWLVSSGSARDLLPVNLPLRTFLQATRSDRPETLASKAERFGTVFNDPEFRRIMSLLIQKRYFIITGTGEGATTTKPLSEMKSFSCADASMHLHDYGILGPLTP